MGLSGSKTDHPLLAAIAAGDLDEVKKIPLGADKTLDNITDSVRNIQLNRSTRGPLMFLFYSFTTLIRDHELRY